MGYNRSAVAVNRWRWRSIVRLLHLHLSVGIWVLIIGVPARTDVASPSLRPDPLMLIVEIWNGLGIVQPKLMAIVKFARFMTGQRHSR